MCAADMDNGVYTAFARAALTEYGLPAGTQIELINLSENATFLTSDGGQCSILRVHRPGYHSLEAIESELAWLDALRNEAGIRTPRPLPALDGRRVVRVRLADAQRHVVRFEWLPGVEPSADDLVAWFVALGEITARMHGHARAWRRPSGFTRLTWDEMTILGEAPAWGRWQDGIAVGEAERRQLGRVAAVVMRRLANFGKRSDRFGLIHADLRLANLLTNEDAISVIDFDDCGFGWYLYDLGTALSFIEDDARVAEWVDAWVRGYRRVSSLSPTEEREIGTFIMLRRLALVAWVGSHQDTDLARDMGAAFTRASCDLGERYLSTMSDAPW